MFLKRGLMLFTLLLMVNALQIALLEEQCECQSLDVDLFGGCTRWRCPPVLQMTEIELDDLLDEVVEENTANFSASQTPNSDFVDGLDFPQATDFLLEHKTSLQMAAVGLFVGLLFFLLSGSPLKKKSTKIKVARSKKRRLRMNTPKPEPCLIRPRVQA